MNLDKIREIASKSNIVVVDRGNGHLQLRGVVLANHPQPTTPTGGRANQTRAKRRLFRKSKVCRWCGKWLTLDTATVDHVIPLSQGGLDNDNNRVLACYDCNHGRGNEMPGLKITVEIR